MQPVHACTCTKRTVCKQILCGHLEHWTNSAVVVLWELCQHLAHNRLPRPQQYSLGPVRAYSLFMTGFVLPPVVSLLALAFFGFWLFWVNSDDVVTLTSSFFVSFFRLKWISSLAFIKGYGQMGVLLSLLIKLKTIKISPIINLLNPTCHVMHQQFHIQQLYVLPTLYLCVLYLSENKQRLEPLTS